MGFNWGVIGTGTIAYDVSYAIESVPGNKISAVTSGKVDNARQFASTFREASLFESAGDLIEKGNIDVVYIASPNHMHLQMALLCAQNKKAFLCEKPLSVNKEDALLLKETIEKEGVFGMEAMWILFTPYIQELLKIYRSGKLGEIKHIRASFGHVINKTVKQMHGEGVLADLGVYLISLVVQILGKPDDVSGYIKDTYADALLHYNSGASASISCSYTTELENEICLHGEKGTARLHAPFYRSGFITTHFFDPRKESASTTKMINTNPYALPGPAKYVSFLKRYIKKSIPVKSYAVPFKGNAYHYQIEEVNRCLKEGLIQSDVWPLSQSASVAEVIDTLMHHHYSAL